MTLVQAPRPERIATALAAAAEVECVLVGKLDLAALDVVDVVYGSAASSPLSVDEVTDETLRAVELALRWQRAGSSNGAEVVLTVEPCPEASTLWITSGRCLVGLVAPPESDATFVTFAHAEADVEFTRRKRDVARVALLHASAAFGAVPTRPRADAELVVERLAIPILVVDHRGEVLYRNAAATSALAVGKGLGVVERRLWVERPDDRKRLADAITAAMLATPRQTGVVHLDPEGGPPLVLCVLPAAAAQPLAIVAYGRALAECPMADAVLQSFGLTLAERRLALHFLGGASIEDAAVAANLKKSTARSYLNRIFGKTHYGRQAELVALLTRLVPPLHPVEAAALASAGRPQRSWPVAGHGGKLGHHALRSDP